MTHHRHSFIISAFFFFLYAGYGIFYPMLGIYLKEQHFSGLEMGVMMSISPLLLMVFQPIWGLINDFFQKPHLILIITSLMSAVTLLFLSFTHQFSIIMLLFILFSVFQSAINPLSDSLVVSFTKKIEKNYGDFRLWGAISFALAAWLMGWLGGYTSLLAIFYLYAFALMIVALLSWYLPYAEPLPREQSQMWQDLRVLFRLPAYLLFLVATFCVLGPMLANNNFFGIFYQFVGGTLAGVGVCFLIGAGSEAPFMKVASRLIGKYGYLPIILSSAVLSAIQYYSYAIAIPVNWVPWITSLQGFSIGLFIPASVQMVGYLAPQTVQTTAIAVYNAVANGIGTFFFLFVGGLLLDYFPVTVVYWFFADFTLIGVLVILWLFYRHKKNSIKQKMTHLKEFSD
ncbi:MFS transporter, PPP family, 3-phenylpropionic acid transporter [Seinonella peptonophila]|uniref:MFS transporter, PPP family, 3-phenylpropionic acid transporter n=1 Tax=Seinonella peptonophila TaxID=112248 RepID=A0A1M4U778_9BACL|nr:MFS transporter [Seinonella peptonophila]SHE52503.1 MFS transporter, PPP family, 3-phenylpropionic acid transporter [Seinonella peptonophila]